MKYLISFILLFFISFSFGQTDKNSGNKTINLDLTQIQDLFSGIEDVEVNSLDELAGLFENMKGDLNINLTYRDENPARRNQKKVERETIDLDKLGNVMGAMIRAMDGFVKEVEKIDPEGIID